MASLLRYRASLVACEFSAPWFARSASIDKSAREIAARQRFRTHIARQRDLQKI
jgi:hypothetical protein